jgi:murein DD-endopeptidase MepM/ murein hydrolase activator NlpD
VNFQIILLPEDNYWEWVRACRDYVLAYGCNLTSNRETAANYMAPSQVITFPLAEKERGQFADLAIWVEQRQPGIRLDPVAASNPRQLRQALKVRLEAEDRYGQRQRPFYLLWPTDYPIVTQKFGANPQIYTRFGMPGHEGLDIRALPNTNVYACAEGTVYLVHTNPKTHAYGIHIRIRHAHGYRTVYGHLARALVQPEQEIAAGQVIGLADSTGASTAHHLHFTLKQDGATARKETKYPKDVIDPTEFMVWPDGKRTKEMAQSWSAERCLIGVHGPVDGPLEEADFRLLQTARVEAVKVNLTEPVASIEQLRSLRPSMLIVVRLAHDFSQDSVGPPAFLAAVTEPASRLYEHGVRYFEVGTAPNLQLEGWNRSWRGGQEYATWFLEVLTGLRQAMPEAKFGFPGLSPGGHLSGWRSDAMPFLEQADSAAAAADWVGVICHWVTETGLNSPDGGLAFRHVQDQFPGKLLMITEFSNPASDVPPEVKGRQYRAYYGLLRDQPGIGAAFAHPLAASQGYEGVAWRGAGSDGMQLARIVGERDF